MKQTAFSVSRSLDPSLDPLEIAPRRVQDLWTEARELVAKGQLELALATMDSIFDLTSDEALLARLECARAAILLELGVEVSIDPLRSVLMESGNHVNQLLAAYQIARHFELLRHYKKALFYGAIALDRVTRIGRDDWLANVRNLHGNLLMAESRFDEALEHYRQALETCAAASFDSVWRARIEDNVGYCWAVLGEPRSGLTYLYRSLRELRRCRAERYQISTLLDLSFALLEVDRPDLARQHSIEALILGRRFNELEAQRNALYLQSSAAKALGLIFEARRCLDRLAHDLGYPELTDLLMATDARALVNLKA